MTFYGPTRRTLLKRLVSMTVVGATGMLRSLRPFAGEAQAPPRAATPDLQGKVIHRQHPDYELWRQSMVWHLSKPDRYPDLIVQPQSEEDAAAAVRFAAANDLRIAVRGGGHNATGSSVRDGGMLLDMSRLRDIHVDGARQIAAVQPGVRSQQLITHAREHGLCFPVPHCPSVGLSGFTMGGGIGWNYSHRGGMATLSIDAADIVTADGEQVHASAQENPELLWAVRGAGPGFFALVTRLYLRLYPSPRAILASSYIHPLDNLETVTKALDELMAIKDDRLEVLALLLHNPEAPPDAPPEQSKVCFVSAFAFGDTPEESRRMLAPVERSPLARDTLTSAESRPYSFETLYNSFFSPADPAGAMARYAVDNVMTDDAGGVLRALADHFRRAPAPGTHVLAAYGMNMQPREDACFSSIADHYVGCFSIWDHARDDAANFAWLDGTLPLMDPFARGHYVNEVEARRHPERIRQCFSQDNWKCLRELRAKHDPGGVFHDYLGHG